MGTDKKPHAHQPKYAACAAALERMIKEGPISPGERLPSIRQLTVTFGVSKNTVIHALNVLESAGVIEAKAKSGFIVSQILTIKPPSEPTFDVIQPAKVTIPELLQDILMRGAAFDIFPLEKPEPLPALLNKLHRHINRHLRTQAVKKSLYYDNPQGSSELRTQIANHYRQRQLTLEPNSLCITSGCQHALFLALSATCRAGDNVIVESPGFYGVTQLLDHLRLHAIEVPCKNNGGIDVGLIGDVLTRHKVAACVVSPAYATPSGASMSESSKRTLVMLANQHDFAIVEDDIYGDLSFRQRQTPLKAFDTDDRVILCSSFSKSLSRDLRIGWVAGARWHNAIVRLKVVNQLSTGQAVQGGISDFIQSGDFGRFLRQRVNTLEQQRDQLVLALHQYWGQSAKFIVPRGGLSLWIELPKRVNTLQLYAAALADNIVITPGALFSVEKDFSHFLRLSFCHPLTDGRRNAIKILGRKHIALTTK